MVTMKQKQECIHIDKTVATHPNIHFPLFFIQSLK